MREGKLPPMRRFKFVAPGFLKTHGEPADRGPRFHLDRHLRQDAGGDRLREPGARILGHARGGARQADPRRHDRTTWREVVGVVGDERDDGVDQKAPTTVYWPLLTKDFWGDRRDRAPHRALRHPQHAGPDREGFMKEIRQAVWSVNPNLPLADVRTLEEIYTRSMARTSFTLVMLAIAGGMALLLGIVGIYGVISYSVSQRTREIGIRMALGAQQADADAACSCGTGCCWRRSALAFGLAAAFALTRAMSSLLFGVSRGPGDLRRRVAGLARPRRWRAICRRGGRRGWIRWRRCGRSSRTLHRGIAENVEITREDNHAAAMRSRSASNSAAAFFAAARNANQTSNNSKHVATIGQALVKYR